MAWSVSQGSTRKFGCNKGASPVTSRNSSSRAPFTGHRLLGGKVAAAMQDKSRLANTSCRKVRANAHPLRRRRNNVRFTSIAESSIVTSMSETLRSRGSPSAPETPSRRPSQNSPESVPPDIARICRLLEEIVQVIGTLHFNGRRIDVCVRELQNAANDKIVDVHVSDRLCAREGESSDQQRSFAQCARSEQLSAVSHVRACKRR